MDSVSMDRPGGHSAFLLVTACGSSVERGQPAPSGRTVAASDDAASAARGVWHEFPRLCEFGLRPHPGTLPTPVRADQIATAIAFLRQFRPTKTGRLNSYYLKHEAERWGGRNGMCYYVSNGALLMAALCLGLVIEEYPNCWPSSPNAKIGISKYDFKRLTVKR
jgi:hypothetical protein